MSAFCNKLKEIPTFTFGDDDSREGISDKGDTRNHNGAGDDTEAGTVGDQEEGRSRAVG